MAIVKGNKENVLNLTKEYLKNESELNIVENYILPALNIVGKEFSENKIFLPELVLSSEVAKIAFDEIKKSLLQKNIREEIKGKIILATVEGDVHDIGKNIVKALLVNYGYMVIDLGKNVSVEKILKIIQEENVKLVGLSALMTTTLPSMEKTIKAIKNNFSDCKIMVGGAVLSEEYAKKMGADYYGKNALVAVEIANDFFK